VHARAAGTLARNLDRVADPAGQETGVGVVGERRAARLELHRLRIDEAEFPDCRAPGGLADVDRVHVHGREIDVRREHEEDRPIDLPVAVAGDRHGLEDHVPAASAAAAASGDEPCDQDEGKDRGQESPGAEEALPGTVRTDGAGASAHGRSHRWRGTVATCGRRIRAPRATG
jgi:hypothetical protein